MAESLVPPLHQDSGIGCCHCSHPPVRCRDLGPPSAADQATGAVSSTLLVLHLWHQMARPRVERSSHQESQPAQHRVHFALGAAALGWPHHKGGRCTHFKAVFFNELQEGKRDHGAPRKRYKDQLKKQPALVMAAGSLRPRQLTLISEKSQS